MNKCVKCGTGIPDGKHFCRECFETEMQKYRELKAEYDAKLAEWKSMSPGERASLNGQKNEKSLRTRAILFSIFLAFLTALAGLVVFFISSVRDSQPYGAYVLFGVSVVLIIGGIILANKSTLFRHILGKAFSLLFGVILGALVGIFIAYIVAISAGWIGTEDPIKALITLFSSGPAMIQWLSLGASLAIPTLLGGFIGFRYTGKVKLYPPVMPSQSSGTGAQPGVAWWASWQR